MEVEIESFGNIIRIKIKSVKLEKCNDAANFILKFDKKLNSKFSYSPEYSFPEMVRFNSGFCFSSER